MLLLLIPFLVFRPLFQSTQGQVACWAPKQLGGPRGWQTVHPCILIQRTLKTGVWGQCWGGRWGDWGGGDSRYYSPQAQERG